MKTLLHASLAAVLVYACGTFLVRADTYPSRPIRIIVPSAAGGVLDFSARRIVDKLNRSTGQPVIVDNRPGANGFIAAETAARAKPDGHTVFMAGSSQLAINPALFSKLPYDPSRDFEPVILAVIGQPILVVGLEVPGRTLAEFIAYVKARPRQVTAGFPSIGSPQHLAIRLFEKLAGVELVHVPYKNQPQVLTDLIGGQIQMTVEFAATAAPHVQSGKSRALTIVGSQRKRALPEVPTAAESGLPGFEISGWHGYLVPAGTPPFIIARLNKELSAALRSKDYVEVIQSLGGDIVGGTPEEFKAFIKLEQAKWAKIVAETGVRLD